MRDMLGYDLTIRSQLPVIGALPLVGKAPSDKAEIEISFGKVEKQERPLCVTPDGMVILNFPKTARFACDAERIVVDCAEEADPLKIQAVLIANALPCVLWQRDDIVLHSCAFIPEGAPSALTICAASGGGKSTILRSALSREAKSVGDDTIRIISSGEGFEISGLPSANWSAREEGKRELLEIRPDQCAAAANLAAIMMIENDLERGEAPHFSLLSGIESLTALLEHRHRPSLPRLLGKEAANLPTFAQMARLPVYRWHRHMGSPDLTENEFSFLSQAARERI